jgi:hypothetical protein
LRQVVARNSDYPPVVFVYMGSVDLGRQFFGERWPEAHAIADPRRRLYKAFGLRKGSLMQLGGPGAIMAGTRALVKGNIQSIPPAGTDPTQMPGVFLIQGDQVLWEHEFSHVGDQPDWAAIPVLSSQD